MSKNMFKSKQTIRFLKWTQKYPGWWQLICEPGNEHMNPEIMCTLINRLAKEGFYEILFVLLEVHKNAPYIQSAKESLLQHFIVTQWENGNKEAMIQKLTYYLQ